jgi:hypothetical protein
VVRSQYPARVNDSEDCQLTCFAVFEIDDVSAKIRCTECFEANPTKTKWMDRRSEKKHLAGNEHQIHVGQNTERRRKEADDMVQLQAAYATSGWAQLNASIAQSGPSIRPGISIDDGVPDVIIDAADDHPTDYPMIPVHMDPIFHDAEAEREHLRRQVELLRLQAEQMDEFGEFADDSTITNIEDQLHGLCKLDFILLA